MDKEEMVTITKKRLAELKLYEAKFIALENAGVDNWDWYDDAMKPFREDDDDEDIYGD